MLNNDDVNFTTTSIFLSLERAHLWDLVDERGVDAATVVE